MEEKIKTLLTVVSVSLEDNALEKEDLLLHYFRIPSLLMQKFSNNKNLAGAISFIQNVLSYYMYESELEYQFYDKALDYLNEVFKIHKNRDESIIDAINEQIDVMEELFISRTMSTATIVNYFENLIEGDILTDKNYFVINVANRISEEEKMRLLMTIPEVK